MFKQPLYPEQRELGVPVMIRDLLDHLALLDKRGKISPDFLRYRRRASDRKIQSHNIINKLKHFSVAKSRK